MQHVCVVVVYVSYSWQVQHVCMINIYVYILYIIYFLELEKECEATKTDSMRQTYQKATENPMTATNPKHDMVINPHRGNAGSFVLE